MVNLNSLKNYFHNVCLTVFSGGSVKKLNFLMNQCCSLCHFISAAALSNVTGDFLICDSD